MMIINDWDDICDFLFEGTKSEIDNLYCPECKNKIFAVFDKSSRSLNYGCSQCGIKFHEDCGKITPNIAYN